MQQSLSREDARKKWSRRFFEWIPCFFGFTILLGLWFGKYNSFEHQSEHGKVVATYVKRAPELFEGTEFDVYEVVSYPSTKNGIEHHRNCSFYLTSYASRPHADHYAQVVILGTFRNVFLSKLTSECVAKADINSYFISAIIILCFAAPIYLCVMADCVQAFKELRAATLQDAAGLPLVEIAGVGDGLGNGVGVGAAGGAGAIVVSPLQMPERAAVARSARAEAALSADGESRV
jgi:hypothetical protein